MVDLGLDVGPNCFVGVRAIRDALEIHAVNDRSEVVLHGWFSRDVGLDLVRNRPLSLIALDVGTLSKELALEFAEFGHWIVLVPEVDDDDVPAVSARCAKNICNFGITLADKINRSQACLQCTKSAHGGRYTEIEKIH